VLPCHYHVLMHVTATLHKMQSTGAVQPAETVVGLNPFALTTFGVCSLLAIPFITGVLAIFFPLWTTCLPLLWITPVLLFLWWLKKKDFPLDRLIRAFATGFLPGYILVLIIEIIFSLILNRLLQILGVPNASVSVRVTIGAFVQAFLIAGLCEESLKLGMSALFSSSQTGFRGPALSYRSVVLCSAAAALGFATVENYQYTIVQFRASPDAAKVVSVALLRVLLPLHVSTGIYIGIRVHEAKTLMTPGSKLIVYIIRILAIPILVHGSYDFIAFALPVFAVSVPILGTFGILFIFGITWAFVIYVAVLYNRQSRLQNQALLG